MEEIWKPIYGYEGFYEISSLGRVRSLSRTVKSKSNGIAVTEERILNPWTNKTTNYLLVTLYKFGKSKKMLLHRLVAEAFIPNPQNKPCIDHINGVKTDCKVSNLRWCTHRENVNYPIAFENRVLSMSNLFKSIAQIDCDSGEIIKVFRSTGEMKRQTGFGRWNVTTCCQGKRLIAYGYKWKYITYDEYRNNKKQSETT